MRFGRLCVVERQENGKYGDAMWLCRCDCGNTIVVRGGDLRASHTRSCGCFQNESNSRTHTTHGGSKGRLYRIWRKMHERCYNSNQVQYSKYGGRGIAICPEWKDDFSAFQKWSMLHGYADDLTIDRIDNNKGYSPDNCRWATVKEQANNKRNNHMVTMFGRTQNVSMWCDELHVKRGTVYQRFRKGWTAEEAFFGKKMQDV